MKENSHLMIGFAERKPCLISLKSSIKKGKYKVEVAKKKKRAAKERSLCILCESSFAGGT